MSSKYDNGPVIGAFAITPGNAFTVPVRGFHVNVAGDVSVTLIDGSTATFTCAAGTFYPYAITACSAATASGIIGLI